MWRYAMLTTVALLVARGTLTILVVILDGVSSSSRGSGNCRVMLVIVAIAVVSSITAVAVLYCSCTLG